MGIDEKQFGIIWKAIGKWKERLGLSNTDLANKMKISLYDVRIGLGRGDAWIASDHVHNLVDEFGLTTARQRGPEETSDILTDEECIEALLRILDRE
jgi:ribosome-binding protein aMBF1 (putative translation factor)